MKRSHSGSHIDRPKPPAIVCSFCPKHRFIFDNRSLQDILNSANTGCRYCRLIRDVVNTYDAFPSSAQEISAVGYGQPTQLTWNTSKGKRLRITLYGIPKDDLNDLEEDGYHFPLDDDVPEILRDTSPPKAIARTRAFMAKCKDTDGCFPRNTRLPNRVLDLGPSKNPTSIRLYRTRNEEARYVCLSHCWGTGNGLLKTTYATLLTRKRGILESELPKTFLDAVIFTRKLRIRYLWIDSLCIIQDDIHDWEKEASKMQSIYRNSYLTLSASKAGGPDEGLFSQVSENFKLNSLPFESHKGTKTTISFRHSISHLGSRADFPLLNRGWAFQERLLSGRVLHFGPEELAWECLCYSSCECQHPGTWDKDEEFPKFWYPGLFGFKNIVPWQHMWYRIVESYTTLNLTYEKDIFPALSGIAQHMVNERKARYLAGLWQDTFVEDLLWHRRRMQRWGEAVGTLSCARPAIWRAPTWSWASITGAVEFQYDERAERNHDFTSHIQDFNTKMLHTSEDTTGQVKEARLTISGRVASAKIRHDGNKVGGTDASFTVEVNGSLLESLKCFIDYDIWSASQHHLADGEAISCLRVGAWQDPEKSYGETFYLMLQDCGPPEHFYQRIGLLVLSSTQDPFTNALVKEIAIV